MGGREGGQDGVRIVMGGRQEEWVGVKGGAGETASFQ